jgi:hypothetical protein
MTTLQDVELVKEMVYVQATFIKVLQGAYKLLENFVTP